MAEQADETRPAEDPQEAPADQSSLPNDDGGTIAMPEQRRPKRGWITAGVIAAVLVVAGLGMWVWHDQPSFCSAFCHSPMDSYVESYSTDNAGFGIKAHADAGKTCLSCHEAELTTQVSEVMAWASDSYPMTEDGTMLATGKEFASEEFCARSGCHSMSDVVADTWGFEGNDEKYNPHSSHQDYALECSDCHKVHETSVLVCNECHALTMPEGWEAPNE